jgi:hypothetical protein
MKLSLPSLIALLAFSHMAAGDPVGTTFTYQGRLDHNGAPASGSFDLKFELYDAAADGNLMGPAVELPAQNIAGGLFTADLDFGGPAVFDGTAYWVQMFAKTADAVDYMAVPGRTAVRTAPYAIQALSALKVQDGAITGSSLADGAVTGAKLAPAAVGLAQMSVPGVPNAGQLLAFDGNDLSWVNPGPGGGGSGPWLLNGTSAYYSAGKVGIGTSVPAHALSIAGLLPGWTSNGWGGAIEIKNGSAIGWQANAGGQRFGIGQTTGGLHFFRTASNPGTAASPAIYDMWINDVGNVVMTGGSTGNFVVGAPNGETGSSIGSAGNRADLRFNGTTLKLVANVGVGPPSNANGLVVDTSGAVGIGLQAPTAGYKLAVNGALQIANASALGGTLQFGSPNTESGMTITPGNGGRADLRFDGSVFKMVAGPAGGPPSNFSGVAVTTSGNVGIGTTAPAAKLDVAGDIYGTRLFLRADPVATTNAAVLVSDAGVTQFVPFNTATGKALSLLVHDANVRALTIRGGADLAEPFAMSHDGVEPGTVVVIDEKNPGKLKASTRAYDKKVAGIVSGANGIRPGISMIQEDMLEAGENVALSGRVFVKADTSAGAIEPGDLLTTSSTAGRAMKAADHDQAQGAILGKAMTSLNESEGMVLVLVTLQ